MGQRARIASDFAVRARSRRALATRRGGRYFEGPPVYEAQLSLRPIRRQPKRVTNLFVRAALLSLLAAGTLAAQKIKYPGSISEDTVTWRGLRWRDIGIFRGGRSIAVAGSAKRPFEFWMGTTGGGVFKTTDGGNSWSPASDGYFGGTIGSIAVSESDPDVV